MAIITIAEFTDYIRNELGSVDTAHVTSAYNAAESTLSGVCQREWKVASTSTARVYVPDGTSILRIHDCTSVTSITLDGATVASTDYQLEPLNAIAWDGTPWPYERVVRLLGWWWFPTIPGKASVTVTAAWGWSAIPPEIIEAVKILGKGIVELRNSRGGVIASDVFGPVRVSRNIAGQVESLISGFKRAEAFGIA